MESAAIEFARQGFVSVGVTLSWDSEKNQKTLNLPKGWPSATAETYPQYFSKHNNGIALLTGEKSDLYVVDCDVLKEKDIAQNMLDGVEIFSLLIDTFGAVNCPIARSSSGGMHYFFSLSKSLDSGLNFSKNTSKIVVTKGLLDSVGNQSITVDTRGDGGCIIVAPTSINNKKYQWIRPLVSSENLPAMPPWCIRLINESSSCFSGSSVQNDIVKRVSHSTTITISDASLFIKQTQKYIEKIQKSAMAKIWQRSRGFDYSLQEKKECACCLNIHTSNNYMVRSVTDDCFWMRNYSSKCLPKIYNWESHPLLRMVLESPCTDAPYSRMLKERYHHLGYKLVFTLKHRFLNFNGIVWEEMDKHELTRQVDSICGEVMDLLVKILSPEKGMSEDSEKELEKKKARFRMGRDFLRKNSNLNGIVTHFKQLYIDTDVEKELDKNPNLLAVKNGVIDLRTGELREGYPEDYIQTQLDIEYFPDIETEIIDEFITSIFSDSQETIDYVQRLFGYAITGHTREQKWAILTGEGGNGKSLFIGAIGTLLQKWCVTASYDVFFKGEKRTTAGGPTPHLAALKGARICVKEETDPKDKLNVEMLKMITGESPVAARELYKAEESFKPTAFPVLLCNHKPAIDIEDEAMMRRIVVIPFHNIYTSPSDVNRPFDPNNPRHRLKNPSLQEILLGKKAQQQLLTWLVRGAVKWFKSDPKIGLGEQPKAMQEAFMDYKEENDKVKLFINAMCEVAPKEMPKKNMISEGYFVNASAFKERLLEHCNYKCTQIALKEKMENRGFKYDKPRGMTEKIYVGLRLS